jgi:hypothetical protein
MVAHLHGICYNDNESTLGLLSRNINRALMVLLL